LPVSQMYNAPSGPRAMPVGSLSCAFIAGPPSPEKPLVPVPAKVAMAPCSDESASQMPNKNKRVTMLLHTSQCDNTIPAEKQVLVLIIRREYSRSQQLVCLGAQQQPGLKYSFLHSTLL